MPWKWAGWNRPNPNQRRRSQNISTTCCGGMMMRLVCLSVRLCCVAVSLYRWYMPWRWARWNRPNPNQRRRSKNISTTCCGGMMMRLVCPGIFQGCFWGRISAPFPMEKGPAFSQKVDEISQSEAPQTFSNFSSFIHKYLGHLKMTIFGL